MIEKYRIIMSSTTTGKKKALYTGPPLDEAEE